MTTIGLELTSFIDPSLTWKTVSKGRSTSRRSRNMKLVQGQEKRSPKQLNSSQSSDISEKSNVMIRGRRFTGNMEHIPIKKRRFFVRSPSPPLQSPNRLGESEGHVGGQCTSAQHTGANISTESQAMQINISDGFKSKNLNPDGKFDESSVKSSDEVHGTGNEFSGIAILAAAACSDRLNNLSNDAEKSQSQMGGLLDKQHESLGAAFNVKDGITDIQIPDLLGKDTEGDSAVDLSNDKVQFSLGNEVDNVGGMNPINESQNVEQNNSVAFTSVEKEIVECVPNLHSNDVVHVNKESISDLPNEVADRTPENSGTSREYRLHWDLNTVMDEWDDPVEDTGVSSAQAMEVAPIKVLNSHTQEDVDGSKVKDSEIHNLEVIEALEARRSEATVSCDEVISHVEVSAEPGCVDNGVGFTNLSPTISRLEHCSEVLFGFVTGILKGTSSPSNANNNVAEIPVLVTDHKIQHVGVNEDVNIDHSLSLGLNGIKLLAFEETSNGATSENPNLVVEETSCVMQAVQSEEQESSSLFAPLLENASLEVKDADYKDCKRFKVRLDENNYELTDVTYEPTAPNSLDCSRSDAAALNASELGGVSCKVNDLNCKIFKQPEQVMPLMDSDVKHGKVVDNTLECLPLCPENQIAAELEDSRLPFCSSKLDDMLTTSTTMRNDQATGRVIAKQNGEKHTVTCYSESGPMNHNRPEPTNDPLSVKSMGTGHGSHVSIENSSQVTENAVNVNEMGGGYDSHLEDGELREPHFWEDNEGEEMETEHVDYDSDNRDGFVFYEAANDSVQLSGEVLVGECEKEKFRSDNFSSVDGQPNPAKSSEENCSLRFQGRLSNLDSLGVAVCTKQESPAMKACSGASNSGKVEIDHKDCRSSIEADSVGKDIENDPPRTARGASASGRDSQFSDKRITESIRRSSSDGRDESRSQQPSMQIGRFGGRPWNPEQKSIVGNAASEDDSERIVRASVDTSPIRNRRPRIINTSRSGYQIVRRRSPGEKDGDCGVGMMKLRDFSPDNIPRNGFGRLNGMNRIGFREGYRRPNVYDPPKSAGGGPLMSRFGRRERSFSPVGDRFHKKSTLRSRTRSPDFRSEARMGRGRGRGRGRLPYQQSNHAAEHLREERSPPRRVFNQNQRFDTLGSPGRLRSDDCPRPTMRPMRFHNTSTSGRAHDFDEGDGLRRKPLLMQNPRRSRSRSRSSSPDFRSNARMGPMRVPYQPSADHIRERRSPVRVFRPYQRYEGGGSPVRVRTDECSRPMMRPQRFPDSSQSGRGHDFSHNNSTSNTDEYRRKPRNIFERIHPIRNHDMEGDARRFPHDEEGASTQIFRRNENYMRGPGDRRPVEFRGPREERGNVRYNNNSDRVFYSGPKQQFGGGMRDYGSEEGIPTRRVRQP